jgi:hypothetical protein
MTMRILPLFLLFFATLPCARAQPDASQAERCVRRYAAHYRVSPELIAALIDVESRWNPRAVSDKGAMGLMQLMPATARRYGAIHPFDVEEMLRALEGFVQHAGPTSADGFWMATMSLVNWVANVILPVFALTQLAAMALHMGGVVSEIYPGSAWIRKFIAAMGALMVSGMVRLAESMVTHAHGI